MAAEKAKWNDPTCEFRLISGLLHLFQAIDTSKEGRLDFEKFKRFGLACHAKMVADGVPARDVSTAPNKEW